MLAEVGPPQVGWAERRRTAALVALDLGWHRQAMGHALQGLEVATALNAASLQARSHVTVALIYSDNYDLVNAERHFTLARELALPDPETLGRVIINLAHHLLHGRKYLEAYHELDAQAALFAAHDDLSQVAVYHVNMVAACFQLHRQNVAPTERWADQVRASAEQLVRLQSYDHPVAIRLDIFDSLAQAALLRGDTGQALDLTRQRIELARQADSPLLLGNAYRQLGQVSQAQQHWEEAIEAFTEALKSYGEGQQRVAELELREELAAAHASSGDYRTAYLVQRGDGETGLLMEQILRQQAQIGAVMQQVNEADGQASRYREASEHDYLTGVANRAQAARVLGLLQEGLDQGDVREVALAIFDLDHFKAVNDTYGHDVGDEVLIGVAQRVKTLIRDQDLVSRHGGEEFLLILRETSPEETLKVCERLRQEIGEVRFASWPDLYVTASFGISEMRPGLGVQEALRKADVQLYRSKREGRNRVSVLV